MNQRALPHLVVALLLVAPFFPNHAVADGLGIPTKSAGLGFGNLEDFSGLRFNFSDRRVQRVTGINTTFWIPKKNDDALYKGLSLGLVGPAGGKFQGIAAGIIGVGAEALQGVAVGGIGVGTEDLQGVALGGIGVGAQNIQGVVVGGLGVGAEDISGIALGGLGVGAEDVTGLALGGLGVGAEDVTGLALGGLGVGGQDMTGVFLGGLGVGGESLTGLAIGGLGLGGQEVTGVALSVGYLKAEEQFSGFGTGAYTNLKRARGLVIGIFNRADVLEGVQIGLLNYAGNNPRGLKWLPGINLHF